MCWFLTPGSFGASTVKVSNLNLGSVRTRLNLQPLHGTTFRSRTRFDALKLSQRSEKALIGCRCLSPEAEAEAECKCFFPLTKSISPVVVCHTVLRECLWNCEYIGACEYVDCRELHNTHTQQRKGKKNKAKFPQLCVSNINTWNYRDLLLTFSYSDFQALKFPHDHMQKKKRKKKELNGHKW